jgi:hydrogenase maturation protein HypF
VAEGEAPLGVLDWRPTIEAVVRDVSRGAGADEIAARFHEALADGILKVAGAAAVRRVALSGGCFQNRRLLEATTARLRAAGYEVLLHRTVPPGDGGVALGQVAVAAARLAGGEGGG